REREECPVEDLPQRVRPPLPDEVDVGVGHVVGDVGDGEVRQREEDEHEPADAHEEPRPGLEVLAGAAVATGTGASDAVWCAGRHQLRKNGLTMIHAPGIPAARVRNTTPESSSRWL